MTVIITNVVAPACLQHDAVHSHASALFLASNPCEVQKLQ